MNKTEDILEKLKAIEQPTIDNPDALTDLIMSNLPEQEAPASKPQAMLTVLRIVSSIASGCNRSLLPKSKQHIITRWRNHSLRHNQHTAQKVHPGKS